MSNVLTDVSDNKPTDSKSTKNSDDKIDNKIWMVRACHLYDDEYDNCVSFRSRFQQYFVWGEFEDCSSWIHDYRNCQKWKSSADKAAVAQVIANEEIRRGKRLNPHFNNPVWENRTEPPSDWNAPLPPFLAEKQKNTYLEMKSKELKEGKSLAADRICVIM